MIVPSWSMGLFLVCQELSIVLSKPAKVRFGSRLSGVVVSFLAGPLGLQHRLAHAPSANDVLP
jgi:hypothetical protein